MTKWQKAIKEAWEATPVDYQGTQNQIQNWEDMMKAYPHVVLSIWADYGRKMWQTGLDPEWKDKDHEQCQKASKLYYRAVAILAKKLSK